ncbi:hypothetical protein WJX72_012204 [[Myrmecia] bisecta]|uniref:Uncharacterized protein n=1 Tax=[Myrmecia] bisecta TaxID=41462 RepID=A0AAW1P2Z1_9CHLO
MKAMAMQGDQAMLCRHRVPSSVTQVPARHVLGKALLTGVTFGTAFQVTHNNGLLPVYDVLPFKVGPFLESGLVPGMLAPIWVLYAYLQPLLDEYFADEAVDRASGRASSLAYNALNWGVLAAMFLLSDYLYLAGFPHWQCTVILGAVGAAVYKAFDDTRGGLILAALLAVGAPATEILIVHLGLWHYDRPDFFGVCHWTAWCYAAYAVGVGNFGRYLVGKERKGN